MSTHRLAWIVCTIILFALLTFVPATLSPAIAPPAQAFHLLQGDEGHIETVGQTGGVIRAIAIQGNYLYIGSGPRLLVLDNSDPTNPQLLGQSPIFPDLVLDIVVEGNYAYIANGIGGLRILDLVNPAAPTEVGRVDASGEAVALDLQDSYVYLADGEAGIRIINVATPSAPLQVAVFDTLSNTVDVEVVGDYAYLTEDTSDGLRILNVSNPSTPTQIGAIELPGEAGSIAIRGNYAYVAIPFPTKSSIYGLRSFDISDPANPTAEGHISVQAVVGDMVVVGDYAYLSTGIGVAIVALEAPASPTHIGYRYWDTIYSSSLALPLVHVLATDGNLIYGTHDASKLYRFTLQDPEFPARSKIFSTWGYTPDAAVAGDIALVSDRLQGLRALDVSDPSQLTQLGTYEAYEAGVTAIRGDYAYVSNLSQTTILDISNLSRLAPIGSITETGALSGDFEFIGDYLYKVDYGGLDILDISNPATANYIGSPIIEDTLYTLAHADNYSYIGGEAGLHIWDITNTQEPIPVGHYTEVRAVIDVSLQNNLAYIIAHLPGPPDQREYYYGLFILDVSNPVQPEQRAFFEIPALPTAMDVLDNFAYVSDRDGRLMIFEISIPESPILVGAHFIPGRPSDIWLADGRIYVTTQSAGFFVLEFTPPAVIPTPTATPTCTPAPTSTPSNTPTATPSVMPEGLQFLYLPLLQKAQPISNNGCS